MYSVAIADDEVCIREGLRDLVEWHKLGFSLVGAFEDGDELISLLERQPPDLLVTDIRMNRCSGLEVSKYIQEHNLRTRVILISGYKAVSYTHLDVYKRQPLMFGWSTGCPRLPTPLRP